VLEGDRHDVEPAGVVVEAAAREKVYRHLRNPSLLRWRHRQLTSAKMPIPARLHLHEHDGIVMARDDVNFSKAGTVASSKNRVPAPDEFAAGEIFAVFSERLAIHCEWDRMFRAGSSG
jgi:hypothetical protein